jgi:hypothetical protein
MKVHFDFTGMEEIVHTASRRAVSRAAHRGKAEASRRAKKQNSVVKPSNFKAVAASKDGFEAFLGLDGADGIRLAEYLVPGQDRATMRRQGGARLRIKRGRISFLPKAFMIGDRLAIRLRPHQAVPGRKYGNRFADARGLAMNLHGPSLPQLFIPESFNERGTGIAEDMSPFVMGEMEKEFFRQINLLWKDKK